MLRLANTQDIINAAHLAWQSTVDEIDTANRTAIELVRYEWPRTTVRQNGDVVGSPRDIVDTGKLQESQYVERVSSDTFRLGWDVDYAARVHEGETLKNGLDRPARRWTQQAIRGDETAPGEWQNSQATLDVPAHFRTEFRRLAGIG